MSSLPLSPTSTTQPSRASEFFALTQATKCEGEDHCHWCGAPCKRYWFHDEKPPVPFVKSPSLARNPASPYICVGCWLWRKKSVTVKFLDNKTLKDSQTPCNHSWYITLSGSWALRKEDLPDLIVKLLNPPDQFILSFVELPSYNNDVLRGRNGHSHSGTNLNHLQFCVANNPGPIELGTPLWFTVNNTPFKFTLYELQDAIVKQDAVGKEPGVRELLRITGMPSKEVVPEKLHTPTADVNGEKKDRGRPPAPPDAKHLRKKILEGGEE